ncbi:polysaccharide biosynthesis/export family protein [uncultured Desulfosarcina sp.]|uniref:polysaccharide biosynthesis/export family protein n=1 Tax=uncultured Desulfosarcina sp. TaxID=218289 RepID=UPI0029C6A9B6|nr:polysaccharide biosynthesis/export family protein [uncultured Desulfosarcina sp.]
MHNKPFIAAFTFLIAMVVCSPLHAETYFVGPGDRLEISVWRDETLSREIVVPPDGILSFPLIGDVNVANMSVAQIRETIKKRLAEYVPDASVSVILKEINSLKAYVIGQVKSPGEFDITLESRVMQLLAKAGGLTPFAAERDIHILRYQGKKIEKIGFDYKEVLKGNNLEQDIVLKRGDVLVVP